MRESLRHTIADCERAVSIGSHAPSTLQTQHEMDSRLHDQQRAAHERLKAEHHRLMLAVAISGLELRQLCNTDFEVGYHVMGQVASALSQRLLATRLQLLDLFAKPH